ncbi:CYTH domain-containing protein [Candidatus Woesearchaeota archaeon]|nr:CYTH domain-containing protein [Candidatus Woesearchaeota archaeon]
MAIEVEIRSFITEQKYNELLKFFSTNGRFQNDDYQITYYFDCEHDLRIQKNNFYSKIWMKKGKIHDEAREEIEIKFEKDDFEKLEKIFSDLGYKIGVKWFRKRYNFEWQWVNVALDYTKGYGHIIELEKISSEIEKDKTLNLLKERLKELGIKLTSREEFDEKYKHYKENWKELTK